MIQDAAFQMSTEQSLASPPTFPATSSTGFLSTNFVDVTDIGASGGKEQFVAVEITETVDTSLVVALAIWPDLGAAFLPTEALVVIGGHRYISQFQLLTPDNLTAGQIHYLPLRPANLDLLPANLTWRYLNLFYLCASTTTGKVSAYLTDAVTHEPRRFSAKNST